MKTELEELNNYTGPSMNPTFKAGDGLVVAPYKDKKIRPGDVITFKPNDRSHNVVHRVVRVGSNGVRTRGDNNNALDPWILTPDDIIGRVVSAKRKNRELPVAGGLRGRVYGFFILQYNQKGAGDSPFPIPFCCKHRDIQKVTASIKNTDSLFQASKWRRASLNTGQEDYRKAITGV